MTDIKKPRKYPRTKFINLTSSDVNISDSADLLHTYADRIADGLRKNNMSSNLRGKVDRLCYRLHSLAEQLGNSLSTPDPTAFETSAKARQTLEHFLDLEAAAKR